MDIQKALRIFKSKYPDKKPTGYWKRKDKIILNTEPIDGFAGATQFVITDNKEVYGCLPFMFDLTNESMVKI